MAKKGGNPQNLLPPYKPGQSGNPKGRPPLTPEVKEARRFNKTTLESMVNKYLWMSLDELYVALEDRKLAAVESWMISIIAKGRTSGDWAGFEWIAQRLIGKVKEQIEVTAVKPYLIEKADGSVLELGATRVKELEASDVDGE